MRHSNHSLLRSSLLESCVDSKCWRTYTIFVPSGIDRGLRFKYKIIIYKLIILTLKVCIIDRINCIVLNKSFFRSSWLVAGKADPAPPYRSYQHPDGPFTAEQLLSGHQVFFWKIDFTFWLTFIKLSVITWLFLSVQSLNKSLE
jgi:hypothetical protein